MSQDGYAPTGAKRTTRKAAETKSEYDEVAGAKMLKTEPSVTTRDDVVGKRIEQMRAERKARGHVDQSELNYKLSVPEVLKDKRLTYRWVNDREMRVYQMEQKGWQVADNATFADPRNSGLGAAVERIANERTTPKVEKCFLMWKPKEFFEEDKAREQKDIDDRVAGLRRGETRDPNGLSGPESYIPADEMSIK